GLRIKLGLLEEPRAVPVDWPVPSAPDSKETISYFSGCLARHLQPSVGRAVLRLAHAGDLQVWSPETQCCCGLAASSAGKAEEAGRLAWQNIKSFADGRGPILTSCASCSRHLAAYPELFAGDPEKQELARAFSNRVVEFSAFFLTHLQEALVLPEDQNKIKIFYHDPCHLRFTSAGREAPRKLIDRIGNVERVEAANGPQCCGQGGLFHVGYPELSRKIFQSCADGALVHSPDLVTTTCSGCLMQWQTGAVENNLPVRIRHLALVLADCLG
ncbi:MAG: (Fe-S)-binding protein, partial [Desulfobulbaceae bacterium]|nr:(Fe-S)-binding protein [Desulfobulbaceae bacterium]